jgi:hypothetical protein
MELNGAAHFEETSTPLQGNSWQAKELNSQAAEQTSVLTVALQRTALVSADSNALE